MLCCCTSLGFFPAAAPLRFSLIFCTFWSPACVLSASLSLYCTTVSLFLSAFSSLLHFSLDCVSLSAWRSTTSPLSQSAGSHTCCTFSLGLEKAGFLMGGVEVSPHCAWVPAFLEEFLCCVSYSLPGFCWNRFLGVLGHFRCCDFSLDALGLSICLLLGCT